MKEFWIYTLLRIGLFLACLVVAAGLWLLIAGRSGVLLWPLLLAVVVSSVLSFKLLAGPRDRFAAAVQRRAEAASAKFEEMRAKEDYE